METAISIPDDVFAGAELLAHRTKRSRSEIYSAALQEYLARHSEEAVTDAMNLALAEVGSDCRDAFVSQAARTTLEQVEW
jgi:metal-responsive CopG/Arc/MetJ family transcriptional regulator